MKLITDTEHYPQIQAASEIMFLRYQLTRVVLDKGQLNG